MKKWVALMAALALVSGNRAQAQDETPQTAPVGQAAASSRTSGSNWVALGIGLTGLAILGIVVGVTVAAATSPSS